MKINEESVREYREELEMRIDELKKEQQVILAKLCTSTLTTEEMERCNEILNEINSLTEELLALDHLDIKNLENKDNTDEPYFFLEDQEDIDDILFNESPLSKKTKEKLEQISQYLKEHKKGVAKITLSVIALVALTTSLKSCFKNDKNNNDLETTTKDKITSELGLTIDSDLATEEEVETKAINKETVKALNNKGYNEVAAMQMAENFNEETISSLLSEPYYSAAENYATEKDFILDYINDYENARNIYNLTSDKAVDYVNRSYKISETGFYEDATINEIVEIVMTIDNKELYTTNNANLAQSFNTSFNRVIDNYLFGTTTEEDLRKFDALEYFAAEGTDLDKFLTEFATLSKENISNPNDLEAKERMYTYMATFALSLNGYTNVDQDIVISKPYNTNAQINDYYDWYITYNSFIAPLYPAFVNESKFAQYEELQYIMTTALEGPEFEHLCNHSHTLGGN